MKRKPGQLEAMRDKFREYLIKTDEEAELEEFN